MRLHILPVWKHLDMRLAVAAGIDGAAAGEGDEVEDAAGIGDVAAEFPLADAAGLHGADGGGDA